MRNKGEAVRLSSPRAGQIALIVVIGVVLVGLIAAFCLTTLVPARGLRFDFYPRWLGGQALWRGESPYTDAVTRQIQADMFGGAVTGDQQRYAYPAYTAVVLAPFLLLPAPVAISVWMALQLAAVLAVPLLWLALLDWKPPPLGVAGLLIGLLVGFRYPVNLLIIAQFTGTMLLLISLAAALLLHNRDGLAGVVLALATIPPTVAAPVALVILGGYALRGRWRGLLTFGVTLLVLSLIAAAKIGWWLPDFIDGLRLYPAYAHPIWPPSLIASPILRVLLIAATLLAPGWATWRLRMDSSVRQIDFVVTTLIASLLLLPITGNYYLILLIPAIIACLWRACGRWWMQLIAALAMVSPWLYFAVRASAPDVDLLLLPFSVGAIWLALTIPEWLRTP